MERVVVASIRAFRLSVPLRRSWCGEGSGRGESESIVAMVELSRGTLGFGEAVARRAIAGACAGAAVEAIETVFAPALLAFHPTSFPEALEAIDALPWHGPTGALAPAARAAVEVALLDASMRVFRRDIGDVAGWMGLTSFVTPGSLRAVRFCGLLASSDWTRTRRVLRGMYRRGLRHFKLYLAGDDFELLGLVGAYLRSPIRRGKAGVTVDLGGAGFRGDAAARLKDAGGAALSAVEQPLPRGDEEALAALRRRLDLPIIADESVVTMDDGRRLVELGAADVFNICIGKCGGLMPSLRLAALARRSGVEIRLGCVPGATSILSAAGLRFLAVCPGVAWAEGCLGALLVADDVLARPLTFRRGGRSPDVAGAGLRIDPEQERLAMLCREDPLVIHL